MQRETEALRVQTDAMDSQLRELKAAMGDTHVALTAAHNAQTRTAAEVKAELASARAASHAADKALAQVCDWLYPWLQGLGWLRLRVLRAVRYCSVALASLHSLQSLSFCCCWCC